MIILPQSESNIYSSHHPYIGMQKCDNSLSPHHGHMRKVKAMCVLSDGNDGFAHANTSQQSCNGQWGISNEVNIMLKLPLSGLEPYRKNPIGKPKWPMAYICEKNDEKLVHTIISLKKCTDQIHIDLAIDLHRGRFLSILATNKSTKMAAEGHFEQFFF